MHEQTREFDVILWGASGFTGRLVAAYLLRTYGVNGDLKWAIGGRDAHKLAQIRSNLGDAAAELDIVIGDNDNKAQLREITARSKVICTTVGPYAQYGTNMVSACASSATHYCDLSGEVPWMARMIERYDDRARHTGALIVHSCGFDSIPSDIGVWHLQHLAQERFGQPAQRVRYYLKAAKGGISGGTAASLMGVLAEAKSDPKVKRLLADPYALNPKNMAHGDDSNEGFGIEYDADIDSWLAPFLMASINTRIVRRSNALLGNAYGTDFSYQEFTLAGQGAAGWLKASAISAGLGGFALGAAFSLTRGALQRFALPAQGDGPNAEEREKGFFKIALRGTTADGQALSTSVTGDRDPGYGSTCKMLAETAVCLSRQPLVEGAGGCTTPAAAMGQALLEQLQRNAGLSFSAAN